jgi:hypothetical protein
LTSTALAAAVTYVGFVYVALIITVAQLVVVVVYVVVAPGLRLGNDSVVEEGVCMSGTPFQNQVCQAETGQVASVRILMDWVIVFILSS